MEAVIKGHISKRGDEWWFSLPWTLRVCGSFEEAIEQMDIERQLYTAKLDAMRAGNKHTVTAAELREKGGFYFSAADPL